MSKNFNFQKISDRLLLSEPMKRCVLGKCHAACCLAGVWLDRNEVEDILKNASHIQPYMTSGVNNPLEWFDGRIEEDPFSPSGIVHHSFVKEDKTHYGETACVFLRKDDKCALQVTAEKMGLHPWRFKPFYCILHPLDLTDEGVITLDTSDALLDEPGSCLRPASKSISLVETFEPELRYLIGDTKYAEMVLLARQQLEKPQN